MIKSEFHLPTKETAHTPETALYWIKERENIRMKREAGEEGPWSDDVILSNFRFCNVRRQDDRVTKWILEHLLLPNQNEIDVWFISAIARYINWPPMLKVLNWKGLIPTKVENFKAAEFQACIEEVSSSKGKCWTSAYMISPTRNGIGMTKAKAVTTLILEPLKASANPIRQAVWRHNLVEEVIRELSACHGWSTFMAGQVAADLTYIGAMNNAKDLYTFAPIGPGSQKGLNLIHKREVKCKLKQDQFNKELIAFNNRVKDEIGITDLTLHDVQNVMCETSKYIRALAGGRLPRNKFVPETRF